MSEMIKFQPLLVKTFKPNCEKRGFYKGYKNAQKHLKASTFVNIWTLSLCSNFTVSPPPATVPWQRRTNSFSSNAQIVSGKHVTPFFILPPTLYLLLLRAAFRVSKASTPGRHHNIAQSMMGKGTAYNQTLVIGFLLPQMSVGTDCGQCDQSMWLQESTRHLFICSKKQLSVNF